MSANPFGSRLYHNVRTVIDWPAEITCGCKGVVNDQRNVMFACQGRKCFKIRNAKTGVPNRFQVNGFRLIINLFLNRSEELRVGKECDRPGRSGWCPCHKKKKQDNV